MIEAFGLSDAGCVRPNNEDWFALSPELQLYVLADGMGGALGGEHASKLAVETVVSYVQSGTGEPAEILSAAVEEANRRIIHEAHRDPGLHGMGTTLTAAWASGSDFIFAHVGDSRAYIFEAGQLHSITDDQTWVNEVGRRLGLGEDALKAHPMRHVLTMAVGVADSLRVLLYRIPLHPGAIFLLSSDGLHGVLESSVISETLASGGTLQDKCHALIDAARNAGGPDNITAVLLRPEL